MSSTTKRAGKVLSKAPGAKESKMAATRVVDEAFAATWNSLEKDERRQIRRLGRGLLGLPDADEATDLPALVLLE